MTDIVDKAKRSKMMAGIKSENTLPERLLRSGLHRLGYRYRRSTKIDSPKGAKPIRPDIVLVCHRVAIFAHGCYWHQHHGCKNAYSNRNYSEKWLSKFETNKTRDARVEKVLTGDGWRICIIWECVTRDKVAFDKELKRIDSFIRSKRKRYESSYKKA